MKLYTNTHVWATLRRDRLHLESSEQRSMHDEVPACPGLCMMRSILLESRMMIIRIVLYKDRFYVYVINAGDITSRIVLDRRDNSGKERRIHASTSQPLIQHVA